MRLHENSLVTFRREQLISVHATGFDIFLVPVNPTGTVADEAASSYVSGTPLVGDHSVCDRGDESVRPEVRATVRLYCPLMNLLLADCLRYCTFDAHLFLQLNHTFHPRPDPRRQHRFWRLRNLPPQPRRGPCSHSWQQPCHQPFYLKRKEHYVSGKYEEQLVTGTRSKHHWMRRADVTFAMPCTSATVRARLHCARYGERRYHISR